MISTTLSLDPGRTTGYALGILDESTLKINYHQGELDHLNLYGFLEDTNPNSIVCESFEFRQGKQTGVDLYPCELIGVAKLYASMNPVELYMQTAAQGKGYYDNDKLKEMGLYKRGLQHGRDACRHLLQWFTFGAGFKYIEDGKSDIKLVEGW